MHIKKILILIALLGAGYLALRQLGVGDPGSPQPTSDHFAFEGVNIDRVAALRIENLDRAVTVVLERDSNNQWNLTDPLPYPARQGVVRQLLDLVVQSRGQEVSDDYDLEQIHLDPPRAIVEVIERVEGLPVTTRVEVGEVDFDQQRIFVRAGGRVLRVPRPLLTAVEREVHQYRDIDVLHAPPQRVIELRRRGSFYGREDGQLHPVDLEARLDEEGWMVLQPFRARFSAQGIGTLLKAIDRLQIETFHRDRAGALDAVGLDQPLMSIELTLDTGDHLRLLCGSSPITADAPPEQKLWLVNVEGEPWIYEVDYPALVLLSTDPVELLEYQLVSARRESVQGLEIQSSERSLRLDRRGGLWFVSAGDPDPQNQVHASLSRVEDLLTRFEQGQVRSYLPGLDFDPARVAGSFRVATGEGIEFGGEVGGTHRGADGSEGVLFRRFGDEIAGLLEPEFLEIFELSSTDLRSLELLSLPEISQSAIRLVGPDGTECARRRDPQNGLWVSEETHLEDRQLALLVDRLLNLRAQEWSVEAPAPLEQAVEVSITSTLDRTETYRIGLVTGAAGVSEQVELGAERAHLRPGLHAELLKLLGGGD